MHGVCKAALVAIVSLNTGVTLAAQQHNQVSLPSIESYERTLDMLLPRDAASQFQLANGGKFMLVLRFLPSFTPESQIVIIKKHDGGYFAIVRQVRGDRSTHEQMIEIMKRGGGQDAQRFAEQIGVDEKRLLVRRREFDQLIAEFERLPLAPDLREVSMRDGVIYELDVHSLPNRMKLAFATSDHHPIINWMKAVQSAVQKSFAERP